MKFSYLSYYLTIVIFQLIVLQQYTLNCCPVDPVHLFTLGSDVNTTYDAAITKNGTQMYISCILTNRTYALRKYSIAGNTYFLKAQFKGPLTTTHYDYLFVTSKYLVAGSKTHGYMRLWNITSSQYVSQVSTILFPIRIVYSSSLQKFAFIENTTKLVKTLSIASLSMPPSIINSYSKSDDLTLSPTGNLLILFNQTTNRSMILNFNSLSFLGYLESYYIGDKSGSWSDNGFYFFCTTVVTSSLGQTTYTQTFNTSNLISASSQINTIGGSGPNGGSTTLTILTSIYNYSALGRTNNSLYLQAFTQSLIPIISSSNALSFIGIQYPIPARLLQTLNFQFNFSVPLSNQYYFVYDSQKIYFGIIVSGALYYFSFHQSCLTNQYLDSVSYYCLPCQINCAKCNQYQCLECVDPLYTIDPVSGICTNPNANSANINNGPSDSMKGLLSFLRELYFNLILKALNKVPGSRKVLKPLFKFFVNLDDLWLYYYHKRSYCNTTNQMFQSIRQFENQKWQALKFDQILSLARISQDDIQNYLSYLDQSSQNKDNFFRIQNKNNAYFINSMDFYFSNLILIVGIFFLLKLLFNLTRNNFISIFFRQYSFNFYLGIMIMQGNLQYFVYLIINQIQQLFSDYLVHKVFHAYSLITFLALLIFSSFCYTFIYYAYKSHQQILKYFFQNFKDLSKGPLYLFIIFFIKNFILGFVHSFFDYDYTMKMSLLWLCQFVFLSIYLRLIIKKYLENHFRQWILVYCSLLRLGIIFSFYLDFKLGNDFTKMEEYQALIFILYLLIGLISMVFQITTFIYEAIWIFKKNIGTQKVQDNDDRSKYYLNRIIKQRQLSSKRGMTIRQSRITDLTQNQHQNSLFSAQSLIVKPQPDYNQINNNNQGRIVKTKKFVKNFKRIPRKIKKNLQPIQSLFKHAAVQLDQNVIQEYNLN